MAAVNNWETLKEDDDYEICKTYPYQIRRKSNKYIISESENDDGYIICTLNQNQYRKHRLVAIQWLPNPNNLPEVDHINHNRSDYHLENLRWCDKSTNNRNKTSNNGVEYEYFDTINDDAIEVNNYGNHEFEFYYYSESDNTFYYYTGHQYRKLHVNIMKKSGAEYVKMMNKNNTQIKIYINKFKKLYDIQF